MGKQSRRNRAKRQASPLDTAPAALVPRADSEGPRTDGWSNLFTKVGVSGRDKRLSSAFYAPCALTEPELEDLFHGNDLAARICSLPAQEATRQWIRLKIDETEEGAEDPQAPEDKPGSEAKADAFGAMPAQAPEAKAKVQERDAQRAAAKDEQAARLEQAKKIAQHLQTIGAQGYVSEALTWARCFGGAVIYVGADTGAGDDPAVPLDLARVQAVRFLTVFHRYEVRVAEWDQDLMSETYGQPLYYEPITYAPGIMVSYGQKIHASRVIHFDGPLTTRRRKRHNQGWSDSVFTRVYEVLRGYGAAWDGADALIQDFAQAVIKIKGLADAMASNGEDAVKARLELMDLSRSVLRALVMDAEHEDFERKPTPLTGLPELLDRWMHRVSAATGIPVALLFGMSPGGLNATGESDIRFFYDAIRVFQETELRPKLEKLLRIVLSAKEGPTGGEPEGWSFEFAPLWQMSDTEKADLRLKTAQTDAIYLDRQVLAPDEVAGSRWGGDEYSIETTMDDEARQVMREAEEIQAERDHEAALAAAAGAAESGGRPGGPPAF